MAQCQICTCDNKLNFKILIPEGSELGEIKVYGLDGNKEIVSEYTPQCVEDDWESSEDEDYSSIEEEYDPYEHADLTDADREELRLELVDILADMAADK